MKVKEKRADHRRRRGEPAFDQAVQITLEGLK